MLWPPGHNLTRLALVLLLVLPLPVLGQELTGRILSINEDHRTFVLQPALSRSEEQAMPERIVVGFAKEYPLRDRLGRPLLPGCVVRQEEVRLEGEFSTWHKDLFLARNITALHCRYRRDPTGVRFRLGMGCRRGRGHSAGQETDNGRVPGR